MASKEVKRLLKAAKECIDNKDFATGSQHCKNALDIDKANYLACVFYGACLQETGNSKEALNSFLRATALNPEVPLAWKGLCSFYEKQNKESDRVALLNAYVQLFNLEEDPEKAGDTSRKMGILLSLVDLDVLVSAWQSLVKNSPEKRKLCLKVYLSVFGEMDSDITEPCVPIVEEILNNGCEEFSNLFLISTYKKYLKQLYKLNQLHTVLIKSREMYDKYPSVVAGCEWFCKAYLQTRFGIDGFDLSDIPEPSEMYMVLLNQVPDSYLGYTCKGVDEISCQQYVAACESLFEAVQLKPNYGIAWYLLTQAQTWLYRFTDAEHSARQALLNWKLTDQNVHNINNCKYWLAKALAAQSSPLKLTESIRLADEYTFNDRNKVDFLIIMVRACIKLCDTEKYSKYLKLLKNETVSPAMLNFLEALWSFSCGNVAEYERLLNIAAADDSSDYEVQLQMGKLHYEKRNLKLALKYVLIATKMNEWCSENYRYLGFIYQLNGDISKARRCFQKAFTLCPADVDAGIGLSDAYRVLGMEDENLKLLNIATEIPGARWAWLKLGLHYLAVNNPVEAVNSLRVAVRLDPDDRDGWESLGDAYLALGSYTAASKSYQKVIDLDKSSVYSLLQIAMCKHMQGDHEEAVLEFRIALAQQPDSLPGLKAHAVSCLALMRIRFQTHLIGLAAEACQEAVTSLCKTLQFRQDLICIWKLLGDACALAAQLPEKYCKLQFPDDLATEVTLSEFQNISDCLKLAVRFYCHAIALSPNTADLWYDCALCYYRLADSVSVESDRVNARSLALASIKKSLSIDATSWKNWNLLGLISMAPETRNYPIAQHAFVKAINADGLNAVPWCNLGTLYLLLGDLQLANQAFTESQRCDPDYVQCWIGQAMLAENTGHHEAMDLYRHSTQLNFHPEGALGYCSLVLSKVVDSHAIHDKDYNYTIEKMHALTTACDAASWYTERYPKDFCCWNMLGLLSERLGLYRVSVESFNNSLEVDVEQNIENTDKILLNYGRLLVKVDKFDNAIQVLRKIKTASLESACVLAEAQAKCGLLNEAYDTYQSALEWLAETAHQKSCLLVAMAAVLYQHQGFQDCKLLLMQACQLQPVPKAGLFACCALGLLHSDLSLADLALQELFPFQDQQEVVASVALLKACMYLIMDARDSSLKVLQDTTHKHPEECLLWLNWGLFHLYVYPDAEADPKAATVCFTRSLTNNKESPLNSKVLGYAGLAHLLHGNLEECLRLAKKAVHSFPAIVSNWIVLVAAIFYRAKAISGHNSIKDLSWLRTIIKQMKSQFNITENLETWLNHCETQTNLMVDVILSS